MESSVSETIVEVVLDKGFQKPLDYLFPGNVKALVGMRVLVPLKSSFKQATITKIKQKSTFSNLKQIKQVLSEDAEVSDSCWMLADWMSKYYCTPMQRVMRCFIPPNLRTKVQEKTQIFLQLAKKHDEVISAISSMRTKSPLQAIALEEILNHPKGVFLKDLKVSKSAINTLIKKKWITSQSLKCSSEILLEEEYFPVPPKKLNEEQKSCLDAITASMDKNAFSAHLIYGVTGSGKTEVYMQAIKHALENNKSAIMLVPEISLTSQTIERFKARFSEKIAILHHKRSLGERTSAWEDLKTGEAKLVIGARSALFCPAKNLGLIIVDEEHDNSYKQSDEMPCYHGRDTAVMRAHIEKCAIVLGSATPSIESRYNAEVGKYTLHMLNKRATSASMPTIKIIDMQQERKRAGAFTHFSEELISGVKKRLELGEQALLFLNKRGFHRMQVCNSCKHVIKCPHCDLSLTYHKKTNILQCHLCDYKQHTLKNCPNCDTEDLMQFRGFGTEHVERALHAVFPEIRTLRMDRDTTAKKNSHEEMFKQFRAHKADVLIGTQMIAKGFHFPSVTLACILNTDATLSIPDFRSAEQVFQLITQVAGRAGRAELMGEVIIQTNMPEHPVLKLASEQNYDLFYQKELDERRSFSYPPFCHLVKILFSDKDEEKVQKRAETVWKELKEKLPKTVELLPLMPAGHAKVKDQYRFQFLIKTAKLSEVVQHLQNIEGAKIDVDPISTFF